RFVLVSLLFVPCSLLHSAFCNSQSPCLYLPCSAKSEASPSRPFRGLGCWHPPRHVSGMLRLLIGKRHCLFG
ncbi:unnamed protein product, partial [Chrysoparadoxa australica]